MKFGVLALATAMFFPVAAQAADVPGTLAAARQQIMTADYRLSGRLVRVDGSAARTSYGVNIKARWFPGILRVLVEVSSPATARVHVLLEMHPGGITTIQIAHPGDAAATVLPFDKWNTGPLGEGFSYEDFIDSSYFWAGQTDMGEAKFGARNCDLTEEHAGGRRQDPLRRGKELARPRKRLSGICGEDHERLGDGERVHLLRAATRRRASGRRARWKRKCRGHAGSTLLIIDHGSGKAHLDVKDFSSAQLTHF